MIKIILKDYFCPLCGKPYTKEDCYGVLYGIPHWFCLNCSSKSGVERLKKCLEKGIPENMRRGNDGWAKKDEYEIVETLPELIEVVKKEKKTNEKIYGGWG